MTAAELRAAHDLADRHRQAIEASTVCACFCCKKQFPPSDIKEWIDKNQTALCPRCSVDAVIGDAQRAITQEFLDEMCAHWFAVLAEGEAP